MIRSSRTCIRPLGDAEQLFHNALAAGYIWVSGFGLPYTAQTMSMANYWNRFLVPKEHSKIIERFKMAALGYWRCIL
jgi:hypothetical protein